MKTSLPDNFETIANDMGITLYQKFSINEASLFLRCPEQELSGLIDVGKINCIKISAKNIQFLGYQLLEFLLGSVTENKPASQPSGVIDRIIRIKEVESITGLKRVTIWRRENAGKFPRRVNLGGNTVGWRMNEVQDWLNRLV